MKTKKSWAHAYVCKSCQHHNRTTTSLSVGRSVGTCMLQLFVCFFSRALPRNYTTLLPTYSTYQVAGDSKLFQVLLAVGGEFLSFGRASYYITTTTITTILLLLLQQHSKHRHEEFHFRQSAKRVKPQESARYVYSVQ